MAGIFGSMANLTQGDPETKGRLVVFDPAVFKRTTGLLKDWTANRDQWKSLFSKWQTDFDAATPEITSNVNRENDYLKYLRDGGFEKTLAGIRSQERAADTAEKENALDFAGGYADRAKLASGAGTGSSSADFARRLRAGSRIEAEFGGRDTARQRNDLNWVNQLKLGTMGSINRNVDALINRQLTPQQLSNGELISMIQALGGIQSLRMGSASPEFYKDLDFVQRLAGTFDTVVDTAGNLLSAYGGGGYKSGADQPGATTMGSPSGGGAPSVSSSAPYSAGISYDMAAPSGGTMFNYGGYTRPAATGGYNDFGVGYSPSWRDQASGVGMSY